MKNNKKIIMTGMLIILSLFLTSSVFAFAVSVPYMENKQLKLYPGQTKELQFVLQNSEATENTRVKVDIIKGLEIIKLTDLLTDNIYTIPPGQKTSVNALVIIEDAEKIGNSYDIEMSFTTLGAQGSFAFGSSILQRFQVIVGEEPIVEQAPEEKPELSPKEIISNPLTWLIIVIVAIIIVILIIWYIIKRKNQSVLIKPIKKRK